LKGVITDSITGIALKAKVFIQGHDADSSHTYSTLPNGYYHRPVYAGNYTVTYSADGYFPKTINVSIQNKTSITQNIKLVPLGNNIDENYFAEKINISPNPVKDILKIELFPNNHVKPLKISIYDINGKVLYENYFYGNAFEINLSEFLKGIYFIKIENDNINKVGKVVKL
jgi:hypothetical protein